ncbi:MAG: LLM class flavin-dependent oxidoreductase [Candidatus Bathyarchaeia archaeon]
MVKFGIGFMPDSPIEKIVECAKLAEKRQFDFLWVLDSIPLNNFRDAYPLISIISMETKHIMVGAWASNSLAYHPALMLISVLTINELSNGRAMISLSFNNYLISKTLGKEINVNKLRILKDLILIINDLLDGKTVSYNGEGFKFENVTLFHKPKNKIPLYVSASTEEELKIAGQLADGVLLNTPLEYFNFAWEMIKEGAKEVNRDLNGFELVNWLPWSVSKDVRLAKDLVKPYIAKLIMNMPKGFLERLEIDIGLKEKIKASIENRSSLNEYMTDEVIEKLSFTGTIWDCNKKVKEYVKASGWPEVRGKLQLVIGEPFGPNPLEAIDLIGKETVQIFRMPYDC